MDLRKTYKKIDEDLSENGVWIEIDDEGFELKICSITNSKTKALAAKYVIGDKAKNKFGSKTNELNYDKLEEKWDEIIAETIIKDWKGLKDNGQELKYSKETCLTILKDYPTFKLNILELSQDVSHFEKKEIEEIKENLGKR